LKTANRELAVNLSAALRLGDLDYLGTDIEWLGGLLANRDAPKSVITRYLRAYYQGAQSELDGRGEPILDWFARLLDNDEQE
jgi:hypothetical protein